MLSALANPYSPSPLSHKLTKTNFALKDTKPPPRLRRLQNGLSLHLWQKSLCLLTVREQALSVRSVSSFFLTCSDEYLKRFLRKPIVYVPMDTHSLSKAMRICQHVTEQGGYVKGTPVVLELAKGVHEVVRSCKNPSKNPSNPWARNMQQQQQQQRPTQDLIVCDNLFIIGNSKEETTILGSIVVNSSKSVSIADLTVKNPSGWGLYAIDVGTSMSLHNVQIAECWNHGVYVNFGAKLNARDCQVRQNGGHGVWVDGFTTTALLTDCTSHHNRGAGVFANSGGAVDLMGARTSVYNNEGDGLLAYFDGTIINVSQPCNLHDVSHGNKAQNINRVLGGTVQQKRQ